MLGWDPQRTPRDDETMLCFVYGDAWGTDNLRTDVGYALADVVTYYQPRTLGERD